MIKSFRGKTAIAIVRGEIPKGFPADLAKAALRKIDPIEMARDLSNLTIPPGNRLEALVGDRKGQCSIRINRQWRVCFEWRNGDAWNVEVTDYH